ncbi:MAG: hypothetical protein DWQ08_11835 [Proteobacteria bacterium]|nr:MAG: hypothetical protein DWQ08_11835 [Pseudomonadota bacterium]
MSDGAPVAAIPLDWTLLPGRPVLTDGVVHLVACRVPDGHTCNPAQWSLLSEAESRRAARFRFDLHRNRWVAGRSLLKCLLARYAGGSPGSIRLGFGEIGKPYLETPAATGIRFNYTDSGGHLIYALARDVEVGVDLEVLPRATNYAGLAPRKLSPTELEAFSRLPEVHREHAFLANWTRKEAYGKALGVGIRFPMREVTLCEDYSKPDHRVTAADGEYRLMQVAPPFPGLACVAAAAGGAIRLEGFTTTVEP